MIIYTLSCTESFISQKSKVAEISSDFYTVIGFIWTHFGKSWDNYFLY